VYDPSAIAAPITPGGQSRCPEQTPPVRAFCHSCVLMDLTRCRRDCASEAGPFETTKFSPDRESRREFSTRVQHGGRLSVLALTGPCRHLGPGRKNPGPNGPELQKPVSNSLVQGTLKAGLAGLLGRLILPQQEVQSHPPQTSRARLLEHDPPDRGRRHRQFRS
jgi:hypothetical protein